LAQLTAVWQDTNKLYP